jgi:hypothetical protein
MMACVDEFREMPYTLTSVLAGTRYTGNIIAAHQFSTAYRVHTN